MIRKSLLVGALALALFALAGAATTQATPPAGGWFEATDAGDVPKTAQIPVGAGDHTLIIGNLTDVNDADLYQVCLTGGGTFSATTNPNTAVVDPQLFLFNGNGLFVYGNDDKGGGSLQSLLPAGGPPTPSAPGVYYLAISSFANFPVGSPLSGWTGGGFYTGRYEIVLTGAIFCNPPVIEKDPELHNLWLCNTGAPGCVNKESGVQGLNIDVNLTNAVKSRDPKCTGFPNFQDPRNCPFQTIGSFEFEVRYDAKLVTVEVFPGDLWGGPTRGPGPVSCATIPGEGFVQFRCNTKGKDLKINGPGSLATVQVRPTPDVYSILVPNQLNGIATQLINQDCQLSDLQGHPIDLQVLDNFNGTGTHDVCGDAAVTIRYLEGDVHADCVVDVHDQQQIAFRWGSRLGQLLFNDRYDLEPSAPKKGDDDIDAKDLQLVYGRHGSTCKAPHPAQDPVDPKAKVEPPAEPTPPPPPP